LDSPKFWGCFSVIPENQKWFEVDNSGGLPLTGTGQHMMPSPTCGFVRAAHGHAKVLRT